MLRITIRVLEINSWDKFERESWFDTIITVKEIDDPIRICAIREEWRSPMAVISSSSERTEWNYLTGYRVPAESFVKHSRAIVSIFYLLCKPGICVLPGMRL